MKRGLTKALLAVSIVGAALAGTACDGILGFGSFSIPDDGGADTGHTLHEGGTHDTGGGTHRDALGDVTTPHDAGSDVRTRDSGDGSGFDAAEKRDAMAEAACPAGTNRVTLERACTTASCEPFASSRTPYDGAVLSLPMPTPTDAGASPPVDSGTPTYPPCASQTNPVYATGSSALAVLLGEVAAALYGSGANNITLVYQSSSSCIGVQSVLDPSFMMTGTAVYYSGDPSAPTSNTCALPDGGVPTDIGIADVFAGTCQSLPNGLPSTIQENFGPVQVMTFAVPSTSDQTSISLDAAYYVFGFGAASMVPPWTDPSYIFQRTSTSGTQNMIGATIGVPPALWQGVPHSSTGSMLTALQAAGKADGGVSDKTIGILVAGTAAANRDTIRELAFQDTDQDCGYYPDSTPTAFDLRNARDGHYPIWGPSHFYNRVSGGVPVNAFAQTFIDDLSGVTAIPGVDLIALYGSKGVNVVPLCAMHVTRTSDGADYKPYTPTESCDCYYDAQATGQTSCIPCTTDNACPTSAPKCNMFGSQLTLGSGYCEPQ